MSFFKTVNLAPTSLTADSVSISDAISRWSMESLLSTSPWVLITLLSSSLFPGWTSSWGIFGISNKKSFKSINVLSSNSSFLWRFSLISSNWLDNSAVSWLFFLSSPKSLDNLFLRPFKSSTSVCRVFLLDSISPNNSVSKS